MVIQEIKKIRDNTGCSIIEAKALLHGHKTVDGLAEEQGKLLPALEGIVLKWYEEENWKESIKNDEEKNSKWLKGLIERLEHLGDGRCINLEGYINIANIGDIPPELWNNIVDISQKGYPYNSDGTYEAIFKAEYKGDYGLTYKFQWSATLFYQGTSLDTELIVIGTRNAPNKDQIKQLLNSAIDNFMGMKEDAEDAIEDLIKLKSQV